MASKIVGEPLSAPVLNERLPCGSISTARTLNPRLEKEDAKAFTVVVFPTPPF